MRVLLFSILSGLIIGLFLLSWKKESSSASRASAPKEATPTEITPPDFTLDEGAGIILPNQDKVAHIEPDNAIPGERILKFRNDQDYLDFLASLEKRGLKLLKRNDRFRTALVGYRSGLSFDGLDDLEYAYNYPVFAPLPPDTTASAQAGATGFGSSVLNWLGITSDHSSWGEGVLVAVIDSGISAHKALSNSGSISQLDLSGSTSATDSGSLSHGTAVASLISGDHPLLSGVAPASDLLSLKITNADGFADSFTLAEAILQAADSGAQLINISMGSSGNSFVVQDAVNYAHAQGIVIIAASGNDGSQFINFPAAYENTIAVGAVEALGNHLDFSNGGPQLDLTAPGFEIYAAWGNEESVIAFSGTSAAAPLATGTIAAVLSENPELSPQQAADIVITNSNESGVSGQDPLYGNGIIDPDRAVNYGTPDRYDPAIASQILNNDTIDITVQNRGTEDLFNSTLTVLTSGRQQSYQISHLEPGGIQTVTVPTQVPTLGQAVQVRSSITNPSGDLDPSDSNRTDTFLAETEE